MATNSPSFSSNLSIENDLHLKRPCLIITDLEQSLKIYRDILGFTLNYVNDASPDSYLYKVFQFPPNARLKFAALSTEYEPRSLALTEIKESELPSPPIPNRIAIVIRVLELPPIIQKIRELGLKIIEPHSFTAPPNLLFTEQAFYDYDDHLIVLYDQKLI